MRTGEVTAQAKSAPALVEAACGVVAARRSAVKARTTDPRFYDHDVELMLASRFFVDTHFAPS